MYSQLARDSVPSNCGLIEINVVGSKHTDTPKGESITFNVFCFLGFFVTFSHIWQTPFFLGKSHFDSHGIFCSVTVGQKKLTL